MDWLYNAIVDLWGKFVTFFEGIVKTLWDVLTSLWENFVSFITGIVTGIWELAGWIVDNLTTFAWSIVDYCLETVSEFCVYLYEIFLGEEGFVWYIFDFGIWFGEWAVEQLPDFSSELVQYSDTF